MSAPEPQFGPGQPDFVNAEGVKWWAKGTDGPYQLWRVHFPNGDREYAVLNEGQVVYSTTALDAAAVWMQMHALAAKTYGEGG